MELNDETDLVVRTFQDGGYAGLLNVYCREHYRRQQRLAPKKDDFHRCQVTGRRLTSDGYRYTAEIVQYGTEEDEDDDDDETNPVGQCETVTKEILWDIPRDAFLFDDTMYSRDHLQPWAFRQPIGIPDYMMPEAWKNLA